jgi:hypothetical protein
VRGSVQVELREWLPRGKCGRVLMHAKVSDFSIETHTPIITVPLGPRERGFGDPMHDPLRMPGVAQTILRFTVKPGSIKSNPRNGLEPLCVRVEAIARRGKSERRMVFRRCAAYEHAQVSQESYRVTVLALMDSTVKGNRRHGTIGWIEDTRR